MTNRKRHTPEQVVRKPGQAPRRRLTDLLRTLQVGERMACRLVGLSRSACRRPLKGDTTADPDQAPRDPRNSLSATMTWPPAPRLNAAVRGVLLLVRGTEGHPVALRDGHRIPVRVTRWT